MSAVAKAFAPVRWVLSFPAALVGPIFGKELRVSSRRRRNYVLRAGYLALMLLFVLLVWQAAVRWENYSGSYAYRANKMAEAGRIIVTCVVWFQFVVLQFMAVVMLSNSISEEIYKRTLGVLMTTPIVSLQIVTGKLFSKLLQLLMMLALSLPLLVVVRVFGGVPWDFVVAGTCLTLTAALFAAAVSMFFSILFRRAFVSILLTLGVGLVLYALIPLIIALAVAALSLSTRDKDLVGLMTVAVHAHPFWTMMMCTIELMEPRATAFLPSFTWWVNCIVMLAATFGVLAACVALVRRVGLRQACGGGAPSAMPLSSLPQPASPVVPLAASQNSPITSGLADAGAAPTSFEIPPPLPPPIPPGPVKPVRIRTISGSPVLWRELRAVAIRSRVARYIVLGVVGLLLLIIYGLTASIDRGFHDGDAHMLFVGALTIIATIATAVYTAVNVTSEKESGTWEILLVTPLSEWHVLGAKAAGCVRRCLPIWLLPIGHGVLFAVLGTAAKLTGDSQPYLVHPIVPFHLALVAVSVIAFFTGTGLLFGAWMKRTTTAVVLNLGLALLLWAALPGAMYLVAEGFSGTEHFDMEKLAGFTVDANPVYQAGQLTLGASGMYRANTAFADMDYHWPGMESMDLIPSTVYLAFFTAMYVGLGAAAMLLARRILRRRAA